MDKIDIQRCGYCGVYVKDGEYMTPQEEEQIGAEKLNGATMGYCPNAQEEHAQQNPEQYGGDWS